ncbi:MAG TPA: phosphatase PAP2 family protein [Ktedonobacterales bacterium]
MGLASERENKTEHEHDEMGGGERDGAGEMLRDLARTTARDVDRAAHLAHHERLPRGRVLTRGLALATIYALSLVALILLAVAAHAHTLLPFDLPFSRELQEHPTPTVSAFLAFISAPGYFPYAEIIEVVCVLALVLLRLRLEAIFLLATALADALGALIKVLVNRQRPSASLVHVAQHLNSPSFPSGHTLHYTVFYGFLAFVLITSFRASWWRNVLVAICFALIVLVGISRVYLGEHWLTDVLGGYLLGGLFLLPVVALYLWARAHLNSATLRPLPHPARPE